jgi:hypothetical protein
MVVECCSVLSLAIANQQFALQETGLPVMAERAFTFADFHLIT